MDSRCERATASAHALGSPERGAVAPRSGVTEGLVPMWMRCGYLAIARRRGLSSTPSRPGIKDDVGATV